jgi:hypothetical protein
MTVHQSRLISTKLLVINAVTLLTLLIAVILPDYYINSPVYVDFTQSLAGFEWLIFAAILLAGIILSGILASIKFKNLAYLHRFQVINILLDIAFLIFISYHGIMAIVAAQREYELLSSEYIIKAKSDMKRGLIIYETAGFPVVGDSAAQAKDAKIDSLMRTYGLAHNNIGCVVTAPLLRAQSDYKVLTASYLEKRNGPGWKHRMDKQIEQIREN